MRKTHKEAQSTIEYLLMLGAIILVLVVSVKSIAGKTQRQTEVAEKSMDKAITIIDSKL